MTNPPNFPSLAGLGWPIGKAQRFKTRTQKAVSGRILRIADQLNPIWTFTLTVPLLRDANDLRAGSGIGLGIGFTELRALQDFFASLQGSFGNFLYSDPSDNQATAQSLGTGDASTKAFALVRALGGGFGSSEPVLAAASAGMSVYLNGVLQAGVNWSPSSVFGYTGIGDTITFTTAPASGVAVTATFSFSFLCHFADDNLEFENFLYQLWSAKQVKFESVLS